ncbi:hypothetical protein BT96DRAFT_982235 [Gymnopus androsaceus JB14]|uniref:Uncharacterized protein n=1 Tax=Gymnopus androsaceus JB14 TaxID=1447944 RepID=A0A6A4GH53_9AGAR|nr:hypothetical protein BT96DRAFT_982235 [Gymnopus androsaceus JB14]
MIARDQKTDESRTKPDARARQKCPYSLIFASEHLICSSLWIFWIEIEKQVGKVEEWVGLAWMTWILGCPWALGCRAFSMFQQIVGNIVDGGQVSENANSLENCQNPYNHRQLPGTTRPPYPRYPTKSNFLVPACNKLHWLLSRVKIVGPCTDEVDRLEPDFRVTFYGPNHERLEEVKSV